MDVLYILCTVGPMLIILASYQNDIQHFSFFIDIILRYRNHCFCFLIWLQIKVNLLRYFGSDPACNPQNSH